MTLSRQYLWRKSIQQRLDQLDERGMQAWASVFKMERDRDVTGSQREDCYKWFDAELDCVHEGEANEWKFERFIGSMYPNQSNIRP